MVYPLYREAVSTGLQAFCSPGLSRARRRPLPHIYRSAEYLQDVDAGLGGLLRENAPAPCPPASAAAAPSGLPSGSPSEPEGAGVASGSRTPPPPLNRQDTDLGSARTIPDFKSLLEAALRGEPEAAAAGELLAGGAGRPAVSALRGAGAGPPGYESTAGDREGLYSGPLCGGLGLGGSGFGFGPEGSPRGGSPSSSTRSGLTWESMMPPPSGGLFDEEEEEEGLVDSGELARMGSFPVQLSEGSMPGTEESQRNSLDSVD